MATFAVVASDPASPLKRVVNLRATSHCEGLRVDLTWTNPTGDNPTRVRIMRSTESFARRYDDRGVILYTGASIEAYTDGSATSLSPYPNNSGTALQPGQVYYYTVMLDYGDGWHVTEAGMVAGLSLRDYMSEEGHYLYNLLPSNIRKSDGDPTRGSNQYKLRDICDVLQCKINLYRGHVEVMQRLRDPVDGPAGLIGWPMHQTCILEGQLRDLGYTPERAYDEGVLRRLAYGLVEVYRLKGSCLGLVLFVSLLTEWVCRCDEVIEPNCGINSLFTLWDGESYTRIIDEAAYGDVTGTALTATVADGTTLYVPVAEIFDPAGGAADLPVTATEAPAANCIIDAMGTWCCLDDVAEDPADPTKKLVTVKRGFLRRFLTVGGVAGVNEYTVQTVTDSTTPWQYVTGNPTNVLKWGHNAWAGYKLKDSANVEFDIVSSVATDNLGNTVLTLSGSPAAGNAVIAKGFAGGQALLYATVYCGYFSMLFDPRWDYRLATEADPSPFSFLTVGAGAGVLGFVLAPSDVIVMVKGIGPGQPAEAVGSVTGVAATTITDSTAAWIVDELKNYYLVPNWNQRRVYKITGNTATTITAEVTHEDIDALTEVGSKYVLLHPRNALKLARLYDTLSLFLPDDTRAYVRFEV